MNSWRSSTLLLLLRSSKTLASERAVASQKLLNELWSLMTPLLPQNARKKPLETLIEDFISLHYDLRTQRAQFDTFVPRVEGHGNSDFFSPHTMDDVSGEEEGDLTGKKISLVSWPGLIKHGDERGERQELYHNVISRARVICLTE